MHNDVRGQKAIITRVSAQPAMLWRSGRAPKAGILMPAAFNWQLSSLNSDINCDHGEIAMFSTLQSRLTSGDGKAATGRSEDVGAQGRRRCPGRRPLI